MSLLVEGNVGSVCIEAVQVFSAALFTFRTTSGQFSASIGDLWLEGALIIILFDVVGATDFHPCVFERFVFFSQIVVGFGLLASVVAKNGRNGDQQVADIFTRNKFCPEF